MIRPSSRVQRLPPSATVEAHARVRELEAGGARVTDLTAGEPDRGSPAAADAAGIAAIRAGETRYGPAAGLSELRDAVGATRGRTRDEVVVTTGAKQALHAALQALVDPGDEVLLPSPCWVSFPAMIELAGGVVVRVPTRAARGFVLDPDDVAAAITPRTRVLVVNSPGNPTGAVLPRSVLLALADLAAAHELTVVSDEIYAGIAFGEVCRPGDVAALRDRTVVIDGVSKSLAMTGWRVGWALGPEAVVAAMIRYQGQTASGPSVFTQRAALAALGTVDLGPEQRRRRDAMHAALTSIPGVECVLPGGAIYLFPSFGPYFGRRTPTGATIDSSRALAMYLLEHAHVAGVSGDAFGADQHVRFSLVAESSVLIDAAERIGRALAKLS